MRTLSLNLYGCLGWSFPDGLSSTYFTGYNIILPLHHLEGHRLPSIFIGKQRLIRHIKAALQVNGFASSSISQ